jgi:hypothetical protein
MGAVLLLLDVKLMGREREKKLLKGWQGRLGRNPMGVCSESFVRCRRTVAALGESQS